MTRRIGGTARGVAALIAATMLLFTGAARGQLSDEEVKAAFLYNFSKFVQWPDDSYAGPKAPLVMGVLGNDGFGDLLENFVAGKTVSGRGVIVHRGTTLEQIGACHLLFVGRSEHARLYEVLDQLQKASVVTVGETEDFISAGGMIQLGLVQNRVRFAINRNRAENAGIRISSKVLNLSRIMVAKR
jgi:hypothetical protein